jgi:hypothetical protein
MPSGTHLIVTVPDDVDGKLGLFASPPPSLVNLPRAASNLTQSDNSKDTGISAAGAGELHSRAMVAVHSEGCSGGFQRRQPVTRAM